MSGSGKLELLAAFQDQQELRPLFSWILVNAVQSFEVNWAVGFKVHQLAERIASMSRQLDNMRQLQDYNYTLPTKEPITITQHTEMVQVPPRRLGYRKVRIVPVVWAHTECRAFKNEINLLLEVFRKYFDYDHRSFVEIKDSNNAAGQFQEQMSKATQGLSTNDLLIIIYDGHGGQPGFDRRLLV